MKSFSSAVLAAVASAAIEPIWFSAPVATYSFPTASALTVIDLTKTNSLTWTYSLQPKAKKFVVKIDMAVELAAQPAANGKTLTGVAAC